MWSVLTPPPRAPPAGSLRLLASPSRREGDGRLLSVQGCLAGCVDLEVVVGVDLSASAF